MRTRAFAVAAVMMTMLVIGCAREDGITSSYGSGVLSGQLVMAGGGSPAGVEVTVAGTGMTTVVGEDGRFVFAGVPEGAQLHIHRGTDVDAGFPLFRNSGSVTIEVRSRWDSR